MVQDMNRPFTTLSTCSVSVIDDEVILFMRKGFFLGRAHSFFECSRSALPTSPPMIGLLSTGEKLQGPNLQSLDWQAKAK